MRKRPIEQKADAILRLRKSIRAEFKDIRNNNVVAKSMWSFVNTLGTNTSTALFNGVGETSRGKKKRKAEDNDDDDDYKPEPIQALGKIPTTRSKQQKTE